MGPADASKTAKKVKLREDKEPTHFPWQHLRFMSIIVKKKKKVIHTYWRSGSGFRLQQRAPVLAACVQCTSMCAGWNLVVSRLETICFFTDLPRWLQH